MFFKKFISLDIGSENLKIVSGRAKGINVSIDNLAVIPIKGKAMDNGKIISRQSLSELLQESLDMYGFKENQASLTSNSTLIINREIIVPKVEGEELNSVINFEIQQYLPINIEDYIVQHRVIENLIEENIEKLRIFVVVYPKKIVEDYISLIEDLGLEPYSLDVSFNATNKLFKEDIKINEENYERESSVAVIDMGAETLTINIFSKGEMEFSRIVETGGKDIDKEITRNFHTDLKEGEKRKIAHCDLMMEDKTNYMEEVNYIIKRELNNWIEEINRIIQYYKSKKRGNNIDKIYIYGGSSRLNGIEAYIANALNIPVVKINSMSNVVLGKNVCEKDMDYCLNAIGALIRL